MKVKVAEKLAEVLECLDIRHVFGIIGAGNVHIFEAISRRGFSELVCVHHEQVATMAMQTYYRTSGRLAAALLTTGAGSTNGITGVLSAWMDSVPGLVIAGNENSKYTSPENRLRIWGVQGYDSVQMVEKVTKYAVRVIDAAQVPYELNKAAALAIADRGGPTWVEIPMNIQSSMVGEEDFASSYFHLPSAAVSPQIGSQLESIRQALASAHRPLLWLGTGIRQAGAQDKLPILLEQLNIPALVSWSGIDMIDSNHPLVMGRAGVYGQRAANFILQNCDYLLAIGTRLAIPQIGYDLNELARKARIDVVDIDPLEVNKHASRTTENLTLDAGKFIDHLLTSPTILNTDSLNKWLEQCRQYQKEFPWIGPEHADREGFINSYRFMELLNGYFKPDQIVVTDAGTALLSGHQILKMNKGQRLMTSTGLGEMGFGLPAALGSSFARGRGEVMCLNCDGGMMMNLQELQTIVHHHLPIKLFIFNNDGYLMIKHTQKSLFNSTYVATDRTSGVSCPDFSKLATAFGIPAYQIRTWEEARDVIPKVQAELGPVICEVFMHPEQLFVPKLSVAARPDGTLVSPPLEDLSPLLPLAQLERVMGGDTLNKSKSLR